MKRMLWLVLACARVAPPSTEEGVEPAAVEGPGAAVVAEGHPMRPIHRASAAPDEVRFLVLGDGGNGNSTQYDVADAMKTVCDRDGCDFAIYTGDNIYTDGCDSVDDEQFQSKFEIPYAELDFPFYMALGNHDYGGGGSGYEFWKGDVQVEYTDYSDKWTMPDVYYDFVVGPAHFYAIDSNAAVWGFIEDQIDWLDETTAANSSTWQFAFSHHPYRSNGPHGNAGEYDGYDEDPISSGALFKRYMDSAVCGTMDIYFSGHDHSLQWLAEPCDGTELLVSGAASSPTGVDEGANEVNFSHEGAGFLWVEVVGGTLTARFYDSSAELLYTGTLTR